MNHKVLIYKILQVIILLLFCAAAHAQCLLANKVGQPSVFQNGEKVSYTLSYTWGAWVNVGEVEFLTTLKDEDKKEFYHVEVRGKTFSFFDKFFKVRDYFATKVDSKTLQPFYFRRDIDEGGYRRTSYISYSWKDSVIRTSTQRLDKPRPVKLDTLPLTSCTFDVISIFYYYRNCDFSKMKEKTRYSVELAMDDAIYHITYKLHGAETVKVKGVGKFKALKFSASLIAGSVFTGKEQVFFWVTDDENRVPVYVEAPIKIGSIRARIKGWENLRHELNYEKL
ncbi:MAG: DUF3108 domain-containing protein [Prevotellaceae bacterium]|nr:DUF3108 domain-containing protein [Prevotellaceae bacterium]